MLFIFFFVLLLFFRFICHNMESTAADQINGICLLIGQKMSLQRCSKHNHSYLKKTAFFCRKMRFFLIKCCIIFVFLSYIGLTK